MNPTPLLYLAFKGLNDSMKGTLDGTKLEHIKETISNYAIASSIASVAACAIPGVAGVVAALTQGGFVWATYVKINNTLGISMSENTAKFIGSAAINGALGYIMIYVAALIYLQLITKMMQPDGTLKVMEEDDTKHIIEDIIKQNDLKKMIEEGRNSYKSAKADGSIDQAKKHPKCPNCGAEVKPGQKFCSDCGSALK